MMRKMQMQIPTTLMMTEETPMMRVLTHVAEGSSMENSCWLLLFRVLSLKKEIDGATPRMLQDKYLSSRRGRGRGGGDGR